MKYIGAVMIFISVFALGISAGDREKRRLKECEEFLRFFEYVRNQVGYFLMPTKLIYRGFESDVLSRTGFLSALCDVEHDEVYYDAWTKAFDTCEGRMTLSPEEKAIVRGFGAGIGKSDEHLQMKNFDLGISQMKDEIENLKCETSKSVKVYTVLGFAAGAAAVILIK